MAGESYLFAWHGACVRVAIVDRLTQQPIRPRQNDRRNTRLSDCPETGFEDMGGVQHSAASHFPERDFWFSRLG